MRELPEFQVLADQFSGIFSGKTLTRIEVINPKKIKEKPADLHRLQGQILQSVCRLGKELQLKFSGGCIVEIDLKQHGRLELFEKNNHLSHTIIEFSFSNGKGIALTDFQGSACVTINPVQSSAFDALSEDLYNRLLAALQTKAKIKALLTNQKVIRGIGSVYADEILWEARISPLSVSNAIPQFKINALANAIKDVLLHAQKQILCKKLSPFSCQAHDFLKVFGKEGEKSPCGAIIKVDKKGGHCTYYTLEQVLYS